MVKNNSKNVKNKKPKQNVTSKKEKVVSKKNEVIKDDENFLVEKNADKKALVKKIFDIAFWVVILFLLFVWLVDFIRVRQLKEPKFCVAKSEYTCKNDDAHVDVCTGLGYKVFTHTKDEKKVLEFRPLFTEYKEVE